MAVAGGNYLTGVDRMLAYARQRAEEAIARAEGSDAAEQVRDLPEYITHDLNSPLWGKQLEIARSVQRYPRTTVRSAHAVGKSYTAARVALAYVETHPQSIVITTAPTSRQVRNVLWRYIRAAAVTARTPLRGRMLTERYEIAPDWYALGFKGSDNNSDAVQGFHADDILVIVDEAAGVAESVLQGLEAILTGSGARLLMIGNPTSTSGTFRRSFHEDGHLYNTITISAFDTPNFLHYGITRDDVVNDTWQEKVTGPMPYPALVDPEWVARQFAIHGEDSAFVHARIDAVFPSDDDSVLIALAMIENAEAEEAEPNPDSEIYAGIDVARSGTDETAICVRQGDVVLLEDAWKGADIMKSVGRVQATLEPFGGRAVNTRVDVIGLGAGLADRLRELDYRVTDVNVGAKSSDREQWPNLRHELWWQIRERFYDGRIMPAPGVGLTSQTKAQLSDIHFSYKSGFTKPVIEPKDDTKKRTGMSPDRAEAVMLAFADLPHNPAGGIIRIGSVKGKW